jgi:hypothetical protein
MINLELEDNMEEAVVAELTVKALSQGTHSVG